MQSKWKERLLSKPKRGKSWIKSLVSGSLYKVSDIRRDTAFSDIQTQIDVMRALARDSQVSTALSYYATDATTTNTEGQIIWATSDVKDLADIINSLFKRWDINSYARDHILELATIGNLYIPTTQMYSKLTSTVYTNGVVLDTNSIKDAQFDIIPSKKLLPENVIHLYLRGVPKGYKYQEDDKGSEILSVPESGIIHFSLGGLLGEYTVDAVDQDGNQDTYDIKFAQPLLEKAVNPTQTLGLLEDALLLSSLIRTVKFIAVDCGNDSEESSVRDTLEQIKGMIEQQISIDTSNGDYQSFVNPQSPNNIIYVPKVNGQDPISVTDLNMSDANDSDSKLLDYYLNKKLSVLGVPKEAMNFSSNEGLGGAGSVLSQRSAIYANALQRLETAYKAGWTQALNTYFKARNLSGYVDAFELHMNPIVTQLSTVEFEQRDSAMSQAQTMIELLQSIKVSNPSVYKSALKEILTEAFPSIGSELVDWDIDVTEDASEGGEMI